MSLCIGITSYNCLEYLKNNIRSIKRTVPDFLIKTVVIDNASSDGTQEWLKTEEFRACENTGWTFESVLNSFNGYASFGCFQSISYFLAQTDCSYFLHLDPDSEIAKPDALKNIVRQLQENPNLGAIGEKRYQLRYEHPKARSLKEFDEYIMRGSWSGTHGPAAVKETYLKTILLEKHPEQKFLVYKELCGNVMLFKRKVLTKIGNVDIERFKMWRWDSELSLRCHLWGYAIAEANAVRDRSIRHYGGRSRLREKNKEQYDKQVAKDLAHANRSHDDRSG